jgi:tRNA1(Val) A37 N6-methylase TrmN6
MMFVHLLTGARAIGVEVQQALVHSARRAAERNHLARVSTVHGDASQLAALVDAGTVFFLYCPFSGERLEQTLQQLERFARRHPIRVCTVDLPLPQRPWLSPTSAVTESVVLYRAG